MYQVFTTCLVFVALAAFEPAPPGRAMLDEDQYTRIDEVKEAIDEAGWRFADEDYRQSGRYCRKAISLWNQLMGLESLIVDDDIREQHARLSKAHSLLSAKGIKLSEIRPYPAIVIEDDEEEAEEKDDKGPTNPFGEAISDGSKKDSKEESEASNPSEKSGDVSNPFEQPDDASDDSESAEDTISFTKDIAPILVQRCGQCHVRGSRGQFSMASFENLLKGAPGGDAIVPEEPDDSLLFIMIDEGEMPPRGSIPKRELDKIKQWIEQGAEFDGDDETTNITTFANSKDGDGRFR